MEKSTVFIKVQGLSGSGKTTIAHKIAQLLNDYLIHTEIWEYEDYCKDDITEASLKRNLKALSSKIDVVIQTEQMKRHIILD